MVPQAEALDKSSHWAPQNRHYITASRVDGIGRSTTRTARGPRGRTGRSRSARAPRASLRGPAGATAGTTGITGQHPGDHVACGDRPQPRRPRSQQHLTTKRDQSGQDTRCASSRAFEWASAIADQGRSIHRTQEAWSRPHRSALDGSDCPVADRWELSSAMAASVSDGTSVATPCVCSSACCWQR